MDLLWQDSVGSLLDPLAAHAGGTPGAFDGGDGGLRWSAPAETGLFTGPDSLLWRDPVGALTRGEPGSFPADASGAFDGASWAPESTLSAVGLLWAEPTSSTFSWPTNDAWTTQNGAAAPVSLLWQSVLSDADRPSADLHSSMVETWANGSYDLLWTATGDTAPLTAEPSIAYPLGAAQSLAFVPASQLLWDGSAGVSMQGTSQPLAAPEGSLQSLFGPSTGAAPSIPAGAAILADGQS